MRPAPLPDEDKSHLLDAAARPFAQTQTWRLAARHLASPGYHEALAAYCEAMDQAPIPRWNADKIFAQKARYLVCYLLVANYVRWRRGQAGPATLTALQKHQVASPRQVAEFVKALRLGGFVETSPDPLDRRAMILKPRPRMLTEIARSPLAFLAASERLDPPKLPLSPSLTQDERLSELLARSMERFTAEDILFAPFRAVVYFTERDCGYLILSRVMACCYRSVVNCSGPAPSLTYDSLADRFGVSRQHVGNIFAEAQRREWFRVAPGGRLVEVSPQFLGEFETWAAGQMAHYRLLAEELAAEACITDVTAD